ncbi:major facilitator superfamily domain-containing protein [Infundibulicybe gibba]|nr:major facilitator superfamily domain-containing protein [Infundibulicybe gibba]
MASQALQAPKDTDLEQQRPNEFYLSPTPTPLEGLAIDEKLKAAASVVAPEPLSPIRKMLVLAILSGAQFFDVFNACSAIVSLPQMATDLQFEEGTVQWILSGYTLTFAAFMLVSGRLGDIFHPKPIFSAGFLVIGLLSIPIGASVNPIMAIVFRALQGIGAAMNVPAAVAMISIYFTESKERDRAYAIYGAAGAVGNVTGLILGGILTSTASWRWVFYLVAIAMVPASVLSWFILPAYQLTPKSERRSIDWPGVICLTIGLISLYLPYQKEVRWNSPRVIATLVLSVVLLAAFFFIERVVKDPAFPPSTWSNKNFTPCFSTLGASTGRVAHFSTVSLPSLPSPRDYGWNYVLPHGHICSRVPRRLLLLMGQVFMGVSAVLFALGGDTPEKYWSYIVPGMIIVVMEGARPGEEGVVGAVMYTAYQLGATIGLASQFFQLLLFLRALDNHLCLVVASITIGVNKNQLSGSLWPGYQASFWSVLGMNGLAIITAFFIKN